MSNTPAFLLMIARDKARGLGPLVLAFWACALLALPAAGSRAEKNLRFQRISLGDGLSQAGINTILQDRRGFMWFGTQEGLNRFDGKNFIAFQHDPADPTSLSHDSVRAIVEDPSGVLWVGTDNGGLARFDRNTGTFRNFRHDPEDPNSLGSDRVRSIERDEDGVLWIGTDGGGLSRFDPADESFTRFAPDPGDPNSLSHEHVRSVLRDSAGRLWVGTDGGGLNRFDLDSGGFVRFRHDPADQGSLGGDRIYSLYESRAGDLWIGTADGGLSRLDPQTGGFENFVHRSGDPTSVGAGTIRAIYQERNGPLLIGTEGGLSEWIPDSDEFRLYRHDEADVFSLSDNRIDAIYQDRGGVVWLGTRVGINKWNPSTGSFPHYTAKADSLSALSHDYVTSFAQTPDGAIWIGTVNGLNRFDRDSQTFERHLHEPDDPGSISENAVGSLMVDREGGLWVGTVRSGVDYRPAAQEHFVHFKHEEGDPDSLSFNGVTVLYQDSRGAVWVGTYRGGLNRFDPETQGFVSFRHDPNDGTSLSSDRVVSLFEDSRGDFWVGTDGGGLNLMDRENGTFSSYQNDRADPRSLSSDHVWAITEGNNGDLYMGTQGGGLNRWRFHDRSVGRVAFDRYLKKDGLLSSVIYAMLFDESGHLWLSSNRGLSVFDPVRAVFRNYNTSHGLQSEEFNFGAAIRTTDGQLFFGGINGFNAFHPRSIRTNENLPPVVLTSILKLNQEATFDRPLEELQRIELGYKDTMVTFEFAALDYTAPEKNRYRYILSGFDDAWVELGNRSRATYTNLDAGNYVFMVQAANNDGVWNRSGTSLEVRVLPVPWATWWAYTAYVLVVGLALLYFLRNQVKERSRARELAQANRSLEREISRRVGKERALSREKAKAQEYFQVAEVIMLVLDSDGNIVLVNRKGCEVLGYTEEELAGKNWFDEIVVEPAAIRDLFDTDRAPDCTEYKVLTKAGDERIVSWQTTYLSDGHGSSAGTLSSGSDITEIKRLEEEKLSAESASRAKSQFLANMSHEIRTPMNGVLGMLELLRDSRLEGKQAVYAEKARRSAVNLLTILNEILDFSKIEAGKVELEQIDFDLGDLIEDVIQLFGAPARQKGLQLRSTLLRSVPRALSSDPTRLRQVLANLVGNAVKFTESGFVELEAKALEISDHQVCMRFSIRDTGIGIAPVDLPSVFESFQQADGSTTRNYGGSGLGLAISRAYVEMMGGEIGVDSTYGEGSTFWFEVTLSRQAETRVETPVAMADRSLHRPDLVGRKILLVEDNPINQDVATAMLEGLGGIVRVVGNGLEALDALERDSYRLVLMDCQMPQMDGYTATREIRRLEGKSAPGFERHVPIVAMTAHAMAGEREKCLAAGMDDYLSKPFSKEQLVETLARWLPDAAKQEEGRVEGNGPKKARLLTLPDVGSSSGSRQAPAGAEGEAQAVSRGREDVEYAGATHEGPVIDRELQDRFLWKPLSLKGARRVIGVYLDTAPKTLEGLRRAAASEDLEDFAELVHKFRSSSAMLGASRLADICAEAENRSRKGAKNAFELLAALEREFELVAAALDEAQQPQAAVS